MGVRLSLAACLLLGALSACDDGNTATPIVIGGGGPRGSGDAGGGGAGGTLPMTDAARPAPDRGVGGAGGGAGGAGGSAGAGGNGGEAGAGGAGGMPGECQPGAVRCPVEGGSQLEICFGNSWRSEPCAEDGVCFNGQCLPDPTGCVVGDTVCIGGNQPAVCNPAEGRWQPQAPCGEEEICVRGRCESASCARAANDRSYLGCDYVAIDLPNSAFVPAPNGTTPDAPMGVVVANPDLDREVHITLRDPQRNIARLVSRVLIPLPAIPEIQGLYPPQTVHSEVRDAGNQVVEPEVETADGLTIPPGGLATLLLPRIARPGPESRVGRLAFRLTTDHPVAAYQFSPLCCNYSFSNDASLLVPVSALDAEYRFLGVPSWNQNPLDATAGSPQGMAILAVEDGTDVTITLPAANLTAPERAGRTQVAGNQVTARLDAQEALLLQARVNPLDIFGQTPQPDFSGATIRGTAKLAVFSTHQCAFYPESLGACDHVEEQLFPVSTWGDEYVLVPPVRRGDRGSSELIYWKIQANNAETTITLSRPFAELRARPPGFVGVPFCGDMVVGGNTIVLRNTSYCEFGTFAPVGLQADGPLMVMGIISGQESTGILRPFGAHAGDPAIFLVPPDRQYRADYAFLAPGTYANDYITVVVDPATSMTIDGRPVDLAAGVEAVPGTGRVFKHIEIGDGPHRIQGDAPFGLLVFAFDDFVSYAFTGGLNLEKR